MTLTDTRRTLAALAAASLLALTACGTDGSDDTTDDNAAGGETTTATGDESTAPTADESTATPPPDDPSKGESADHEVSTWFIGDAKRGPVLYAERVGVNEPDDGLADELGALMTTPSDPDYRTLWPEGSLVSAEFLGNGAEGLIRVEVDAGATAAPDDASAKEAGLALQQVVYTLQKATGHKAPVEFTVDGEPAEQVLGVATPKPVKRSAPLQTLNLVSITSPAEGEKVSGTLLATGGANSFEATVPWQILKGDEVVLEYSTMAKGAYGNRLYPWKAKIDISKLEPGTYVFKASTDDPTGGTEGSGPDVDTRTIIVE